MKLARIAVMLDRYGAHEVAGDAIAQPAKPASWGR